MLCIASFRGTPPKKLQHDMKFWWNLSLSCNFLGGYHEMTVYTAFRGTPPKILQLSGHVVIFWGGYHEMTVYTAFRGTPPKKLQYLAKILGTKRKLY